MLSSRTGAFAIAFILLCTYSTVFAETSTTYYEGESESDTKIVALDGDNEDSSVSIKYPATEVLDASIGIQGLANGQGEYPEGLSLKVKPDYEWKYDGQGYGALGDQEKLLITTTIPLSVQLIHLMFLMLTMSLMMVYLDIKKMNLLLM